MKSILIVVFSVLALNVSSQTGNYIVNDSRIWSTVNIHCLPGGNSYSTYYIKFYGDTLIEGLLYQKMWRSDDQNQENWGFYGSIREDDGSRIYLRPPGYIEGLIYDFGVSLGDTIEARNMYLNNDTLHFVVTQVDSVQLLDGYKKRITLFEYMNQAEEIWIEGLGSYSGILNSCFNSYGSVCGGAAALCYEQNGNLVYQNPDYSTCYYSVTVDVNQVYGNEISIYPNPAKDLVNIDITDKGIKEIELLNINGKIILKKLVAYNKVFLNLQEVDKGIYLIKFISNDFSYPPYKLIVD